ncbi:MAG TPA: hypothetical protein PLJ21_12390 [Pseudobdellovibrionaceae bacterium]|nr:hypothetical protein [Pseudobdellovibrionaceae bacterium]
MKKNEKKQKTFLETTYELAGIIKSDRTFIDKTDFEAGKEIISIFSDPNYTKSMDGYQALKQKTIEDAISDLSNGAENLKSGLYGVQFLKNKLSNFYCLHNEKPEGAIVFSIVLKEFVAFKNWRLTEGDDFPQEKVNHSIYYLTVYLSENMP